MLHDRWRPSGEVDEVLAALEEAHGARVGILLGASLLLFAVGRALDGLDVAGGGFLALIALAGIMLVIHVAPLTGPRLRYRVAAMLIWLGESLERRAARKGSAGGSAHQRGASMVAFSITTGSIGTSVLGSRSGREARPRGG